MKLSKRIAISELVNHELANDLQTANQRIDHLTEMLLIHGVEVINHRRNLSLVGYRQEAESKIDTAVILAKSKNITKCNDDLIKIKEPSEEIRCNFCGCLIGECDSEVCVCNGCCYGNCDECDERC